MSSKRGTPTRDQKVENLIFNYSMILMATFEDAFANLASTMTEAMAKTGAAMVDAMASSMGGKAEVGNAGGEGLDDLGPRTSEKVKDAFAEIRTQARAEFSSGDESMEKMIKDPAADEGIRIVESFDFKLSRLTEQLSDDELTKYLALLKGEDVAFMKMLKQLAAWQEKLLKPTAVNK